MLQLVLQLGERLDLAGASEVVIEELQDDGGDAGDRELELVLLEESEQILEGLLEEVANPADEHEASDGAGGVDGEEGRRRHALGSGEQADVVVREDEQHGVHRLGEGPFRLFERLADAATPAVHPVDRRIAVPVAEQVEERIRQEQTPGSHQIERQRVESAGGKDHVAVARVQGDQQQWMFHGQLGDECLPDLGPDDQQADRNEQHDEPPPALCLVLHRSRLGAPG